MPLIAHGYVFGYQELQRLAQHLDADSPRACVNSVESDVESDGYSEESTNGGPRNFADVLCRAQFAYSDWVARTQRKRKTKAPRLVPITYSAKEEAEYVRRVDQEGPLTPWPQRYMLVTHVSRLLPTGRVSETACVESERAKKVLSGFLALVVLDAPEVLSAKDFNFTHVLRKRLMYGGDLSVPIVQ
ncbi:hypothetical protein FISHEDRAFT_78787 [Fistulina hepatica ATCC 64428]|uniref:Uncharacterized protein n=1 Tax=Fistulina hepatica ATCC 64428 TaxID=1128425 RepID=A0A0D7A151_9AGAR|nr:hypothetical protein FISHEDRAFT_78787 [Fistulina hepatica ATCC 64428]